MYPNDSVRGVLCVAIHDVAPATWPDCLRLWRAVRAVADIPVTWLVVPRYHGSAARSVACESTLHELTAQGHEIALHGYTHRDSAPLGLDLRERFLRTVYTQREGEFAAIGKADACRRIDLGLALLRERYRLAAPAGFIAPAWLLGEPAWAALAGYPFHYTTTWRHFHLLSRRHTLFAPALVYTARNRCGRALSPAAVTAAASILRKSPLLRLALHPRDAHHPRLLSHMQGLVERLLHARVAMTKAGFSLQLAARLAPHQEDMPDQTARNVGT